jgi:Reverse transcriptase (RNA-dependent DNA polymerase)
MVVPRELLCVTDSVSGVKFLADTGASYSCLPFRSTAAAPDVPSLKGAGGHGITCFSKKRLEVCFSGSRFEWTFLLAAVEDPIIGADFLRHFKLIVNLSAGCLMDAETLQPLGSSASPIGGGLMAVLEATPPRLRALISQFPEVVNASGKLPPIKHSVQHVIVTVGRPVTAKFHRLDAAKLAAAKAEFLQLEKDGIVRRSSSAWANPLHMVLKKDNSWRPCGDYRQLNTVTVPDKYPFPNIADMSAKLVGYTMFTKLDLKKGYYKIPVAPADVEKTAVITPFELFEFTRMPFGLRNAGQSFQRLMDSVTADLDPAFAYLDDLMIASQPKNHEQAVRAVLERLREYRLVLNLEKCEFGRKEIQFLGHKITASGIEPLNSHVAAVREFAPPQDKQGMQRFLGLVNFYLEQQAC